MTRLLSELQRLFLPAPTATPPDDRVRALMLALRGPADWATLSTVWAGVQQELGLPAPAIAISGQDALQLWFSLAQPVPPAEGLRFLEALCGRYLPELPPRRVQCHAGPPAPTEGAGSPWPPTRMPSSDAGDAGNPGGRGNGSDDDGERWSAWVAPDLAPLFADTPWLDLPPGEDGQAQLLAVLKPIAPAAWAAAMASLAPPRGAHVPPAAVDASPASPGAPAVAPDATSARAAARQFLRGVMDDPQAPLPLRVEAAKALLSER